MKNGILPGLFWSFSEKIFAQLVTFVITIVLARILTPEDYGVIALILVFISLANVFVINGFGEALIQKSNISDTDYSTIFWCSFVFSFSLFVLLFFSAGSIASFYGNNSLKPLIQVLAIKLPISSISTIQHAYVSKNMEFKKFFFSTSFGTIISGIAGIMLAYKGFGPWALVCQYLSNTIIDTLVLLYVVPWKPHFVFNVRTAKAVMNFGWKLSLSAFINSLYGEMRSIIIGKVYSSADLAQYKRGRQFPSLFITNINGSISAVIYPAMSNTSGNLQEIKRLTRRSMSLASFFIFPIMTSLAIGAYSIVKILLTDKWLPCVPFLQLACVSYAFQPIQAANCQAIKAIGRGDIYLFLEIIKKGFGITLLIIFMKDGVFKIAVCDTISVFFSMIVSILPNIFLIDYNLKEQFKDLFPSILVCLTTIIVILPFFYIIKSNYLFILINIFFSLIIFLSVSVICKHDGYLLVRSFISNLIHKK